MQYAYGGYAVETVAATMQFGNVTAVPGVSLASALGAQIAAPPVSGR